MRDESPSQTEEGFFRWRKKAAVCRITDTVVGCDLRRSPASARLGERSVGLLQFHQRRQELPCRSRGPERKRQTQVRAVPRNPLGRAARWVWLAARRRPRLRRPQLRPSVCWRTWGFLGMRRDFAQREAARRGPGSSGQEKRLQIPSTLLGGRGRCSQAALKCLVLWRRRRGRRPGRVSFYSQWKVRKSPWEEFST